MTEHDASSNAPLSNRPADEPGPDGHAPAPAVWSDHSVPAPTPVTPPFWRDDVTHVEAPLYRGDQPVVAPADTAIPTARPAETGSPWMSGPDTSVQYPYPAGSYQSNDAGLPPNGTTPPTFTSGSPERPRRMRRALIGTAVAAAVIGGAAGAGTYALADHNGSTTSASGLNITNSTAPAAALTKGTVSSAAAAVTPSVVTIQVAGSSESGTGSGVILRSDGYILTNDHVVSVAGTTGNIVVQTADGRSAKAAIVGTDASDDLAVIKVTGLTGLKAATFANSASLTVGQSVVAVGAPLGLSDTVTSGIVSATARTVRSGDNDQAVFAAVQTDAAINPGNSGGALVDLNGDVVGINAAIASTGSSGVTVPGQQTTQSGSIGIGFAIPSNEASRIAAELMKTGKASHAVLGVEVASSSASSSTSAGATLAGVTSGGAASSSGLKAGDVVTAVDGSRISTGDDLIAAIRAHAVKDTVTVTYTRGGASHTVKVTLTASGN